MGERILAIDPGGRCGWAHSSGEHGVWQLTGPASEHRGRRLIRMEAKLGELKDRLVVDRVVFEASPQVTRGQAARLVHGQYVGMILKFAASLDAPFAEVNVSTLKKFATGNGHAEKHEMIRALQVRLGIDVTDDNEADAIWLLKFAESVGIEEDRKRDLRRAAGKVKKVSQEHLF